MISATMKAKQRPITNFTTSTGERVTGERLRHALNTVADFWERNAYAIYEADDYATHVSEERKLDNLAQGLIHADKVRAGIVDNFTDAQRLNTELTGECVALLSKRKG